MFFGVTSRVLGDMIRQDGHSSPDHQGFAGLPQDSRIGHGRLEVVVVLASAIRVGQSRAGSVLVQRRLGGLCSEREQDMEIGLVDGSRNVPLLLQGPLELGADFPVEDVSRTGLGTRVDRDR